MRPTINKTEENGVSYQSPHQVRNEKSARFVLDKRKGVAQYSLIEVPCLKEEEREEKEGPRHQLTKVILASQVANAHHM